MDIKYYIYILQCADGSLYTGYTNDVSKRLLKHSSGKGSKYVRTRLPVEVVYTESFKTKSEALKRECAIKKLKRKDKLKLISLHGVNGSVQHS